MNTNTYAIVIGRQFGCGGRDIGKMVADALGVAYYDSELLIETAKNSGVAREYFESKDEKTPSFLSGSNCDDTLTCTSSGFTSITESYGSPFFFFFSCFLVHAANSFSKAFIRLAYGSLERISWVESVLLTSTPVLSVMPSRINV